ncbi:MAG: selenocysteine-specific translation elongation factor [Betaproteobacteria bacterium]|jgi:selenocysteine-specific elongation factor|nr:selenocysteine-specific translation elongation factor [Betaproteobacteria bacterium]NBU48687.1 selenocysteine-specific translation elongation factor [Betaproteobacteria bacterium]
MIVGTAGHIDHGKTSLVKALTGVDADRLKEEKERGITVDLGFAYQAQSDGQVLGFVDVPGHEKLVRNMLAGATGIDHVMLVVAADDGPMPQTREHLAILDLLGLQRGVVALSKCDLVDATRLSQVEQEIRALLRGTALAAAPVLPVSSISGQGLDALREHLEAARQDAPTRALDGHFRLSVDRSFTLSGIGTVVTGTAVSGRVRVGDRLRLSPSGLEVRVRGLHAQNCVAEDGMAGQRLALNLAGVEKQQVQRGHWLVADPLHAPTQRMAARLRLLPSEARALAHWTPVHLHLGAEDVNARVALLEGSSLQPGGDALVQFDLDRPIGALRGDRFIIRDQSALRTLGGGQVVDPFPPPTRRHRAQLVRALQAMEAATPGEALQALLALESPYGIERRAFSLAWNLTPDALAQAEQRAAAVTPHDTAGDGEAALWFTRAQIQRYQERITEALAAHHRRSPDSPGLSQEQLNRQVRDKPTAAVFALLLTQLLRDGSLRRHGAALALTSHETTLQGTEKLIWERIKPWLDEGGFLPPRLSDLLERDRTLRKDQVLRTLQRLQRMGKVHPVGAEYWFQTDQMLELTLRAKALADADPNHRLNVRDLRESVGVSRHLSVPLVEYFDEIGLTERDAVGRHFKRDPRKMFGS